MIRTAFVLHSSKHSFDATRNTQIVGTECVVALPGRNLVTETWFSALPLPRGIFEGEIAELTFFPSKIIDRAKHCGMPGESGMCGRICQGVAHSLCALSARSCRKCG